MSEDDTEFPIKGYKDLPEFTQVTKNFSFFRYYDRFYAITCFRKKSDYFKMKW